MAGAEVAEPVTDAAAEDAPPTTAEEREEARPPLDAAAEPEAVAEPLALYISVSSVYASSCVTRLPALCMRAKNARPCCTC